MIDGETVRADAREVLILANPHAGSRHSTALVKELADALRRQRLSPTLCWRREELSERVHSEKREEIRCVVAAGGDGTFAEVLNRAPGLPVAVLPTGNENLIARHFRFTRSGRKLAEVIATGQARKLDLGKANGRIFFLMASAGFDAEIVERVHRGRRGHIGKPEYVAKFVQTLVEYPFPLINAEVVETGERLSGAMAFVFNLPRYALGLPLGREARADDGKLDLCVFERPGAFNLLRYFSAAIWEWDRELPDYKRRQVKRLRLSSEQPVRGQMDGDPAGQLPLDIEVMPGALTLVVGNDPEK